MYPSQPPQQLLLDARRTVREWAVDLADLWRRECEPLADTVYTQLLQCHQSLAASFIQSCTQEAQRLRWAIEAAKSPQAVRYSLEDDEAVSDDLSGLVELWERDAVQVLGSDRLGQRPLPPFTPSGLRDVTDLAELWIDGFGFLCERFREFGQYVPWCDLLGVDALSVCPAASAQSPLVGLPVGDELVVNPHDDLAVLVFTIRSQAPLRTLCDSIRSSVRAYASSQFVAHMALLGVVAGRRHASVDLRWLEQRSWWLTAHQRELIQTASARVAEVQEFFAREHTLSDEAAELWIQLIGATDVPVRFGDTADARRGWAYVPDGSPGERELARDVADPDAHARSALDSNGPRIGPEQRDHDVEVEQQQHVGAEALPAGQASNREVPRTHVLLIFLRTNQRKRKRGRRGRDFEVLKIVDGFPLGDPIQSAAVDAVAKGLRAVGDYYIVELETTATAGRFVKDLELGDDCLVARGQSGAEWCDELNSLYEAGKVTRRVGTYLYWLNVEVRAQHVSAT